MTKNKPEEMIKLDVQIQVPVMGCSSCSHLALTQRYCWIFGPLPEMGVSHPDCINARIRGREKVAAIIRAAAQRKGQI